MSIAVAALSFFLIRGTPESKAEPTAQKSFDWLGLIAFIVTMVALNIVIGQGATFGWLSPTILILATVFLVSIVVFFKIEIGNVSGFVCKSAPRWDPAGFLHSELIFRGKSDGGRGPERRRSGPRLRAEVARYVNVLRSIQEGSHFCAYSHIMRANRPIGPHNALQPLDSDCLGGTLSQCEGRTTKITLDTSKVISYKSIQINSFSDKSE